jgi:hypothetical protein
MDYAQPKSINTTSSLPIHMTTAKHRKTSITLPEQLLTEYEEFCEKQGMKISSRIAVLIRGDLEGKR